MDTAEWNVNRRKACIWSRLCRFPNKRRQERRRGTQECVRHGRVKWKKNAEPNKEFGLPEKREYVTRRPAH